jgi:anti-anti-sigma factor
MLGTCNPLGEIDTTTAASFVVDLHDAIDDADEAFVNVDCSGLTFIDSAGYHALVDATNYAVRRGHTLVIRNLSPSCARLIRRTRAGLRRARQREVGRVDVEFFPRNRAGLVASQDRQVAHIGEGEVEVEVGVEHEYRMPVRGAERVDSPVKVAASLVFAHNASPGWSYGAECSRLVA